MGIAYSKKRDKLYDFSKRAIFINWGQVYSSSNKIQSFLDLQDKRIGVLKGDIHYLGKNGIKNTLDNFNIQARFIEFDSKDEILKKLEDKKIEVGVVNRTYGFKKEEQYDIVKSSIILNPIEMRIISPEGEHTELFEIIDQQIKILKNDKSSYYYKRLNYWFSDNMQSFIPDYVRKIIISLLVVLILALLIILIIRRQVRVKTKRIREINKDLIESYNQLEEYSVELKEANFELEESYQKVEEVSNKLKSLINFTHNISEASIDDREDFLSELLHTAYNLISEADYGSTFIYTDENKIKFIDTIGHNISVIDFLKFKKPIEEKFNEVQIISDGKSYLLDRVKTEQKFRLNSAMKPVKESILFNLTIEEELVVGVSLDIAKENDSCFKKESKTIMKSFKNLANSFCIRRKYYNLQDKTQKEIIASMTTLLELYDKYTVGHSQNVAKLSVKIAEEMGLSRRKKEEVHWAGMVHDIGKILITIDILNKEGALTEKEYEEIKIHPQGGYIALAKSEQLKNIAKYVLHHHERWDGKGYPEGLQGEGIPLISQILAVADAWDAMTSKRPYRDPLDKKQAIKEIKKNKGTQFSPKVVDVFLRILEEEKI